MGEEQLALTGSLEVLQDEIDVFKDRIDSASEAELAFLLSSLRAKSHQTILLSSRKK